MKKEILKKLGALQNLKMELHNKWVDNKYDEETRNKIELVVKISKCLEEKERGKLKSNVDYAKMAEYLLDKALILTNEELRLGITKN